jgi:cobalt-precorrin 5A hydrolase
MIVAGFGFRGSATAASLASALGRAAGDRGVQALAVPDDKAQAGCLTELARRLRLPIISVPAATLAATATTTVSPRVRAARGTGSVAEAAALAAAGAGARLLVPRQVSSDRRATCAVAGGAVGPPPP